ncbi:hypothetical protein F4780DRAFT_301093 [Xylariomycetidae sp. FL0641]|nr:hypothetical protein F4780DRAFT_301093 [Xylariomycetidae sp. FL0641]
MLHKLLATAALAGLAQASTYSSLTYSTVSGCSTGTGSGGEAPTPVPTSNTQTTVSSFSTVPTTTIVGTHYIDADHTVTVTGRTLTTIDFSLSTVTKPETTVWEREYETVTTATWPVTVCTNGVSPSVVTQYSGSYEPVAGQDTTLPTAYPTAVLCSTTVEVNVVLYPTETSGTTTVTREPVTVTTIVDPTVTVTKQYITDPVTTYASTVTATTTSFTLGGAAVAVSTSCAATQTTTLAAQCAPTNLISSIDGVGLVSGDYHANTTVKYVDDETYNDPSLCCQLCLDNDGCGAMYAGMGQVCGLLYVASPNGGGMCDTQVFTYHTQQDVFPGAGLIVAPGCGSIMYDGEA